MMQREQALKTYISELFQREEDLCEQKISQIEDFVISINEVDSELSKATTESDIELLRKFADRKHMTSQIQDSSAIKEILSLNIATYGFT